MKKYIEIKKLVKKLEDEIAWWQESVDEYHDKEEKGVVKGLKLACELINQQPTTDGWIPCSERLPEKSMDDDGDDIVTVLVTTRFIGLWLNNERYRDIYDFDLTNNTFISDECQEVIAWQPLPPAYKE